MTRVPSLPVLFSLRSHEKFIIATVGFAIFTDLFLYGVIVPIVPYAATPRFNIPPDQVQTKTSTLLAVYAAGLLVACPIVGWFADRATSRRLPLLLGLFALVGSTLLFTIGKTFALLVVARLLQGLSAAVVWTVGLALLVDTVGKDRLGVTMGLVAIFQTAGIGLGPVIGGILYDVKGYYATFYLCFGILAIDIILRLAIIEKKVANRYLAASAHDAESSTTVPHQLLSTDHPCCKRPQPLSEQGTNKSKIPPILQLLRYPRLLTGCWLGFVASVLLSSFDAVIPLYLNHLWSFTSLDSGLIYLCLVIPSIVICPVAGWFIDTRGTKSLTLLSLALLVPGLVALRFPDATHPRTGQVIELCVLLLFNGAVLAPAMTADMTEIAAVVQYQEVLTPGKFGDRGAFAQAYALFNMCFSGGTLVGPLVAGAIRESRGWGTMSWSLAVLVAVTLVPCLIWTGGPFNETQWITARNRIGSRNVGDGGDGDDGSGDCDGVAEYSSKEHEVSPVAIESHV